ncbi:hypothetical protein WA158_002019 [Blastocystis sp. Blastoise]
MNSGESNKNNLIYKEIKNPFYEQKRVEVIENIQKYDDEHRYCMQAAAGYPMCLKHLSQYRYVNTNEPILEQKPLDARGLDCFFASDYHNNCGIYNHITEIYDVQKFPLKKGMGIIYINIDMKKITEDINQSYIQDVKIQNHMPKSLSPCQTPSPVKRTNHLSTVHTPLKQNIDKYLDYDLNQDIDEELYQYNNIYIPAYSPDNCCICQYKIGYINDIIVYNKKTVYKVVPLYCKDTLSELYGDSDGDLSLYGDIYYMDTQGHNYVKTITISNPRYILGAIPINETQKFSYHYEYNYNRYAHAFLIPSISISAFSLSAQSQEGAICHKCRLYKTNKDISVCNCNTFFCNDCAKLYIHKDKCDVCLYKCRCDICSFIFLQEYSYNMPIIQRRIPTEEIIPKTLKKIKVATNKHLKHASSSSASSIKNQSASPPSTPPSTIDTSKDSSSCSICISKAISNSISQEEDPLNPVRPSTYIYNINSKQDIQYEYKDSNSSTSTMTSIPSQYSIIISLYLSISKLFPQLYIPLSKPEKLFVMFRFYIYFCMSNKELISSITYDSHKYIDILNNNPIDLFQEKIKENTKNKPIQKKRLYPHLPSITPRYLLPVQVSNCDAYTNEHYLASLAKHKRSISFQAKRLRFDKSNIHSWGVFTNQRIKKGDFVCEYKGELCRLVLQDIRQQIYENNHHESDYISFYPIIPIIQSLLSIIHQYIRFYNATFTGAITRYINHSCDPNCYTTINKEGKNKKIILIAKRDIEKGEELTYDYKFPFEDVKIPCNCGSAKCRGSLN